MEPIQTAMSLTEDPSGSSVICKPHHVFSPLSPALTPLSRKSIKLSKHKPPNRVSTFTSYHKSLSVTSNNIHKIIKILCKPYVYRSNKQIDELVDFFENFQVLSPDIDFLVAKTTFTQFISATKHKYIKQHDYIFKKHDEANEFYFILRGEAEIFDANNNTIYVLDYGNIFGEQAMFDPVYPKRTTYCKAINENGVHIAYWNRNTYNKYIAPIQKLPIYKYSLFGCDSPTNMVLGHEEEHKTITMKEHGVDAFGIWMACCYPQNQTFAYFNTLYPVLCQVFIEYTQCKQTPSRSDLEHILICYGAEKTDNTSHYRMMISTETFITFFRWFKGTFDIVKDLLFLFDLGCNLFCSMKECECVLTKQPNGTFMLSLSKIENGVNLSYRTEGNDKEGIIKHIALIRSDENRYVVYKNKKCEMSMSMSKLIRSFVKIKYLYTPRYLCVKKSIF